ncbi:MAG: hypothetical protein Q9195_000835 [Heterodermia aff. obscurata]
MARVDSLSRLEGQNMLKRETNLNANADSAITSTAGSGMCQSHPFTATNNIRFDPTYFDTVSCRENELSIGISGPSLAASRPAPTTKLFSKDHAQLDASFVCLDELPIADEWVLVETRAITKDDLEMPVEEGVSWKEYEQTYGF